MFKSITDEYKCNSEDIECLKLLIKKDEHYEGPYTGFCYHPRVLYDLNTDMHAIHSRTDWKKFRVHYGFYSLKGTYDIISYLHHNKELLKDNNLYIAKCTIPKNSKYFAGGYYTGLFDTPTGDGYASNRIFIDSISKYSECELELLKILGY